MSDNEDLGRFLKPLLIRYQLKFYHWYCILADQNLNIFLISRNL